MKKYIFIFIFISSVYMLNQFKYKCKYNQEEYFDCYQYEKEVNFNRFSNVDLFGIMLYGVIKGQLDKEKNQNFLKINLNIWKIQNIQKLKQLMKYLK